MIIKVLHARLDKRPGIMFDLLVGKATDAEYREVATIRLDEIGADETVPADELLTRVWRTMNCVDGDPETEICVRLRIRSMVVGDRVVLGGVTYQCAGVGWKVVPSVDRPAVYAEGL